MQPHHWIRPRATEVLRFAAAVSSANQDCRERQVKTWIDNSERSSPEGCGPIFQAKASWPQLEKAIAALATGDVLVLPEWDRATPSMLDGIQIISASPPADC